MRELPEGPVTIMFTDVEGSTALRTTLGDEAADALFREHADLVREQIAAHKGDDQEAALGDGFLAVFLSTRRAVAGAIAVQRALDAFNRDRSGPPLRVRIGLNTGEVSLKDGQLSGEAVHAAARVCGAASGGQILVSDVTRQLAGTIPDVTFHDAGEHQLKGFPQPWRLWDVVWVREPTTVSRQVFVGREAELAALRMRLAEALDGRGGMVLVGGEPGVGKTALVRQLIREAEQRGALAVFGRCYEPDGSVPYSPFVEMLEQALETMPPDVVREDMGDDAAEVARMVPALRRRFPDIPDPLDLPPEQQRRYFFNAVGSFVARGATRFPLVLVVDDVHWADEPTLLLVEHIASLMPDLRVLGIGTYRDIELDVARPLAAALERMLRARTVERLGLSRFDREGVARMVTALAGRPAPDAIVDAVYDETEGNPFFVEEVFRHLVEEGKVFDDDGEFRSDLTVGELDVPESVRLVVGRRLERLGEQSQKALAAAAVVGRGFPISLLEAVAGLDPATLLDVVDEAEAARVIVAEEREGEVYYTFAHELIRQTLLSGLSILRRQRMHLAIADAIEALDPLARSERAAEVAAHLLQAGAAADQERLVDYLEAAARRSVEAAAFERALESVDNALSVVTDDDLARRASLLRLRGIALRAAGRFEDSRVAWDTALGLYERLGDVPATAQLAWAKGVLDIWLGHFEDALVTNARGIAAVGEAELPERALLNAGMSATLGFAGLYDHALAINDDALALAERLGDMRSAGVASWSRTVFQWSNAAVPEAISAGRSAVARLREAGERWTLVDALAWCSFPLLFDGRFADAEELATEAIELGSKLGHVGAEGLARRTIAFSAFLRRADLDANEAAARADLALLDSLGSPWMTQSHAWLSYSLRERGDLDEAIDHADRAIETEPESAWAGIAWAAKATGLALAGDHEACVELLAQPLPDLPEPDRPTAIGALMRLYGAAMTASFLGSRADGARLYPLVAARVPRLRYVVFACATAERVAAMTAATAGLWEEAERHFAAARQICERDSAVYEEPHVDYWHGRMLLERGLPGDGDLAVARLEAARAEFDRRGAPLYRAMADDLLRA